MTAGKGIALFTLLFLTALAATFPMRTALAWFGAKALVSARAVSGSVWNSHWEDARLGALFLGDARVRLDPFAVFSGVGRFRIDSPLSQLTFVQGRRTGVETATLILDSALLHLPVANRGTISLQDVTVLFDGGTCVSASGRLTSDVFQVQWGGPTLAGDLVCDGDFALTILTGEAGGMAVEAQLRLAADGRYELRTGIANATPALREILMSAGFTGDGETLSRFDEGILGS